MSILGDEPTCCGRTPSTMTKSSKLPFWIFLGGLGFSKDYMVQGFVGRYVFLGSELWILN